MKHSFRSKFPSYWDYFRCKALWKVYANSNSCRYFEANNRIGYPEGAD